ncbi:hypothetical protein CJO82_20340 (plasmid) [Ralstonia solanacearum]|nr:hypothetical protein CJO82_20340 [Ralstonia solanacearum]AXW25989.1 hypothetical protein CJO86_20605 [Ralstonia solanacearum]AXW82899.1 hypothetical protein CJO98_20700 [Ralstonia solanacearum]
MARPAPPGSSQALFTGQVARHIVIGKPSFQPCGLWRSELPTWLHIAAVYAVRFGTAANARRLGLPLTCVLLTLSTTWYLSVSLSTHVHDGRPSVHPVEDR